MKTDLFDFDLPSHLIAQYPTKERGTSRLLLLDRRSGGVSHHHVGDIVKLLDSGSLLVFNNSKVRRARILGTCASSGASVEFLLVKKMPVIDEAGDAAGEAGKDWEVMFKKSSRYKDGSRFLFGENDTVSGTDMVTGTVCTAASGVKMLHFHPPLSEAFIEKHGHIPLPPYIKRSEADLDSSRYQNVYSSITGSAACPTAGLHWTTAMLDDIHRRGIETAFITLHVGMGTFLPVRADNIEDHEMHSESFSIEAETAAKIEKAKLEGRKIIAVGTTTMRTLEAAYKNGKLETGEGESAIFIYGDYNFKVVDALFTNFHTPRSTLLMLASSFAGAYTNAEEGRRLILDAYREAIKNQYRFFSYGDAMLIL